MNDAEEIFLLAAENTKATGAAVATTDALHVYRVEVDTTLGTIEVFYDGQSKLTGVTFSDPNASPDYVSFGEGSNFATGTSDWDYVTHNALKPIRDRRQRFRSARPSRRPGSASPSTR